MSGLGDRRFNEACIKHGKEKVAEMRREQEKMEHRIKANEKIEAFKHVDKKH